MERSPPLPGQAVLQAPLPRVSGFLPQKSGRHVAPKRKVSDGSATVAISTTMGRAGTSRTERSPPLHGQAVLQAPSRDMPLLEGGADSPGEVGSPRLQSPDRPFALVAPGSAHLHATDHDRPPTRLEIARARRAQAQQKRKKRRTQQKGRHPADSTTIEVIDLTEN